jgi:hypothetical protein
VWADVTAICEPIILIMWEPPRPHTDTALPSFLMSVLVIVIVFILCSDPVYCMSSFVFCFSKLTQQLRCLV